MFGWYRKSTIKAGMKKCFVDSAVNVRLAETLVYGPGIAPFYNGIYNLTKGLTNQQSAVIASIVMSMSYLEECNRQIKQIDDAELSRDRYLNMYELQMAKNYLEQVLFLLMSDAGHKWRKIASAYIQAVSYFIEGAVLKESELAKAIDEFDPKDIVIDHKLIASVQDRIYRR